MTATMTLRMERTFRAPADAVFEAWTSEEVLRRWWQPRRLAFTWLWDRDTRRTLIELDFQERDGVTTVHFTHSGLWDEEVVRSHEDGRRRLFDNLERTLEEARR